MGSKIGFLALLVISGTTLITSILGAVFQFDFGWWVLSVVLAVVVAAIGIYLLDRITE